MIISNVPSVNRMFILRTGTLQLKIRLFLTNIFWFYGNCLDGIPVLSPQEADLSPAEDINFWKLYHCLIYSLGGLVERLRNSGFKLMRLGLIDDYNYRVLSLHQKMGFGKVSELRNSCFDHPELADKYQFRAICQKALTLNSLALFCNAVFAKL